jgi:hypothetical protein
LGKSVRWHRNKLARRRMESMAWLCARRRSKRACPGQLRGGSGCGRCEGRFPGECRACPPHTG